MQIRGVEVEFDFLDADNIEKFENEAEKVKEKADKYKKQEMKYSEAIRTECKIIKDFFDAVFGAGMSEKMFGKKDNLNDCIKAFEDVTNAKIEQQKVLESTFARYTPNRAQRRANK